MNHLADEPAILGQQQASEPMTADQRIRALTREMGHLSREIGQKKRNGESPQDLLQQMSVLSKERRTLERALREARAASCGATPGTSAPPTEVDSPVVLPIQPDAAMCTEPLELSCNKVSHDEWDAYVTQHPRASQYHQYCWKHIIEKSFGQSTYYLAAHSTDGSLAGVLPMVGFNSLLFGRYLVSVPFVNYGGALGNNAAAESAMMNMATAIAEELRCGHVEFRDTVRRDAWSLRSDKVAMRLALPNDPQQLWRAFSSKVRAQVAHAERERPVATIGGEELLIDFYGVFAHHMRDLGTPVYAPRFFQAICELAPSVRIVVIRLNDKPVSAGLLLGYRSMLEIPWATTLRSANPSAVNMYLYWTVLQYAISSGYSWFDFGRSTVDSGAYRFKKQWGAKPVPLYWHYWLPEGAAVPRLSPDNPRYRVAIALWKRLPLRLANRLGPPIVRNLP